MKINKHIEIVRSNVVRLSSMSQDSCDAIFAVLTRHYSRVGITTVNNDKDLQKLVALKPDLVFLGMKFVPSQGGARKIWLSELLDNAGIPSTGSAAPAHELEFSKPTAKRRVHSAGLKTSPFCVIKQGSLPSGNLGLKFPLFVKPADRGGGLGIDSFSVVNNFRELCSKIEAISKNLKSDSIVEEYLPGREFSVAILKDNLSEELIIMPLELIAQANAFGARLLSEEVKSSNSELAIEIADPAIKHKVGALAQNVFNALGARDYGRIDIRLDEDGTPHFLEANLLPSLIAGYGSFPKSCALILKLNHESMILHIVRLALTRDTRVLSDVIEKVGTNPLLPSLMPVLEPI